MNIGFDQIAVSFRDRPVARQQDVVRRAPTVVSSTW